MLLFSIKPDLKLYFFQQLTNDRTYQIDRLVATLVNRIAPL